MNKPRKLEMSHLKNQSGKTTSNYHMMLTYLINLLHQLESTSTSILITNNEDSDLLLILQITNIIEKAKEDITFEKRTIQFSES